jgi:uncharacterized protein YndB with AHSA1/START domain
MISIERTLTIHRPVDEVFAYLCQVEHGPQYVSGQRAAHQTSPGQMGIGTTFATQSRLLRRSTTDEVTEYEPNRRLAWKATSGVPATTTWAMEPSGPSTRLTFKWRASPPSFLRLAEPIIQRQASGRADHDLGALKELLAVTRTATSTAKPW